MCGIAGLIGGGPAGYGIVRAMATAQIHRGPDSLAVWADERLALSHTRLRVIDLSDAGRQPMWTPDGRYAIVYNGEVYNFRSLRDRLRDRGRAFRSDTDTEVVLHAWAEWGPACLTRFNGMFAFALYDREAHTLFLIRDRLGIKPLYTFAVADGSFLFGSEVRALLASGLVPRRLNTAALGSFLSQQTVPNPLTLVEGVRMLPPGHWLELRVDTAAAVDARLHRYWHMLEGTRSPGLSGRGVPGRLPDRGQAEREICSRLKTAVERRLVSDVPLGAYLSGGVDSTAIVGLMSRLSYQPIQTFTVVFHEPGFDDGPYSRQVAQCFRTEHSEIVLEEADLLEQVPAALNAVDHPSGDGINSWIVAGAVRQAGLTVALSGLGGDEFFAGYPTFGRLGRLRRMQPWLRRVPQPLRRGAAQLIPRLKHSVATQKVAALLTLDGSVEHAYPVLRQVFSQAQAESLVTREIRTGTGGIMRPYTRELRVAFEEFPESSLLTRIAYAEARGYMHDVLLRDTDQMSMAHSLEVRVPFLDHELVEFVVSLANEGEGAIPPPKHLLKASLAGLLPTQVADRPKSGFAMPFDRWMRGPLRSLCETGLGQIAANPAFREQGVSECWKEFLSGDPRVTWSRPWLLVALGTWLDRESLA